MIKIDEVHIDSKQTNHSERCLFEAINVSKVLLIYRHKAKQLDNTNDISLSSIAGMVLQSSNSKQDSRCSWSILHRNQRARQQCDYITKTVWNRGNHFLVHIQLQRGLYSRSTCFVWVRVRNFMGLFCFASVSSLFKHCDSFEKRIDRLALYTHRVPLILEGLFSSSMRRAQDRKWANASPKQPFHSSQNPCLFRVRSKNKDYHRDEHDEKHIRTETSWGNAECLRANHRMSLLSVACYDSMQRGDKTNWRIEEWQPSHAAFSGESAARMDEKWAKREAKCGVWMNSSDSVCGNGVGAERESPDSKERCLSRSGRSNSIC